MTAITPRRKILIVDDEPSVVRGLRVGLHQFRERWEVQCATSGQEALQLLEDRPVDALVTDVRMPGLDGESLLRRVAELWPATLRVVLSGDPGRASLVRLRRLAHHFFSKPAAVQLLFRRIDDSLEARGRLSSPAARELVCRLGSLPALPSTYSAIDRLARQPDARLEDFVAVLEGDAAVSGDVLRAVNSAWFAARDPVRSLREAVRLLGVRPLCDLVLATEVFGGPRARVEHLRVAAIERLRALPEFLRLVGQRGCQEDLATASVLADIGQLVIQQCAPGEAAIINARVAAGGDRLQVERELMGADHALIGGVMLSVWALPASLTEAVALHHEASATVPTLPSLLALICAVQAHAHGACSEALVRPLVEVHGEVSLEALAQLFSPPAARAEPR